MVPLQVQLEEVAESAGYDRPQDKASPALDHALQRYYHPHGGSPAAAAAPAGGGRGRAGIFVWMELLGPVKQGPCHFLGRMNITSIH